MSMFLWKPDVKMLMGHKTKNLILCEMNQTNETVPLRTLQPALMALMVLQIVKNQMGHIISGKQVEVTLVYLCHDRDIPPHPVHP